MPFDIDKAVKFALQNAEDGSQGLCATYVREALEAGGLDHSHHPLSAKDYGPTLEAQGFAQIYVFQEMAKAAAPPAGLESDPNERDRAMMGPGPWASVAAWLEFQDVVKLAVPQPGKDSTEKAYAPLKGDVVVIQPYAGGSPHGHIALYSGTAWVSDFVLRDMWGGPGYRKAKPKSAIYRPR